MRKIKKHFLAGVLMLLLLATSGCGASDQGEKDSIQQYSNTDFVMDTVLSTTVYGVEDNSTEIKALLQELEDQQLSWRVADSTAYTINEKCSLGESVEMDETFAQWTRDCLQLAEDSQGAFDPTIGNLTRLWNIEGENPTVPAQSDIDQCLKKIGYQNINIEGSQITMTEGSTLDLGAVGKGIACDQVSSYIKEHQSENTVQGAVVAVGGSLVVLGSKPDGSTWNVAVQDPEQEDGTPMGVIHLEGENYISTSGDYEKFFEEKGKKYHHILDPHTGYPSESDLSSVTIVCDNGLLSDGLSTACYVLGIEEGMKLAQKYKAEVIFITHNKEVIVSDGLKEKFDIIESAYKLREE